MLLDQVVHVIVEALPVIERSLQHSGGLYLTKNESLRCGDESGIHNEFKSVEYGMRLLLNRAIVIYVLDFDFLLRYVFAEYKYCDNFLKHNLDLFSEICHLL